MPNIAIYGFGGIIPEQVAKAVKVEDDIWQALHGMKGIDEIVVTWVDSCVETREEVSMPFLRLYYTPDTTEEELNDIIERLDKIDLDLEVQKLESFRLRKSARMATHEAYVDDKAQGPMSGTSS